MKKVLIIAAMAITTLGFSQSQEQGTIQLSVLGGVEFGKVTDTPDVTDATEQNYNFASGSYGLQAQYGLAENFSAGVNLKYGSYILTPKDLENSLLDNYSPTMTLFSISIEPRYYVVNKDKFNLFVGPMIGYTAANNKYSGFTFSSDITYKPSGLNFGGNLGLNYYIWDKIGFTVQSGYLRHSLKGDYSIVNTSTTSVKRDFGGFNVSGGAIFKF